MYEWQHHEADPFDFDYDVFVFLDALNVSLVSFKGTACHCDFLPFVKFLFMEYLAAGGIIGGQEFEKVHLIIGDYLYFVAFWITVDPERYVQFGLNASCGFERERVLLCGINEYHMRDYRAKPFRT